MSPAGWEYADRLKAAVTARRKALREERKERGEIVENESKLVVRVSSTTIMLIIRFGHLLAGAPITLLGRLCMPGTRLCRSPK